MLIYFIKTGIIEPPRIKEINPNSSNIFKTQFDFFNVNQESLLKDIEAADNKLKLDSVIKNNNSDASQEYSISGSDSEPSLDNFDNDKIVKLLPSYVRKKSKIILYIEKFYVLNNRSLN